MRTVLIGAGGQLATSLSTRLPEETVPLTHADLSIDDAAAVEAVLDRLQPQCVVNAAAYNFVDRAEDEPELAWRTNALGPRSLALWCQRHEALLVHISSDYVFGLDRERAIPYTEDDAPGPVGAYGVSKLAGEYFVRSLCTKHFVVRTCGLYGFRRGPAAAGKGNFVETMLRLGREKGEARVVCDQRNTPSFAEDVAQAIASLLSTTKFGLYHATNAGDCTWHEFAAAIFALSGLSVRLTPIASTEFGARAARPGYSVLDNSRSTAATGLALPPWQEALERYLQQRNERMPT